jgi:hypothetical protein
MKILMGVLLCTVSYVEAASANDHYVNGYTKSDGTYVAPHYQTNPNNTRTDNYSAQGNSNPYTGRQGTVDPYKPTPSYGPTYGGTNNNTRLGY